VIVEIEYGGMSVSDDVQIEVKARLITVAGPQYF
jgi:hypothetical protein